MVLGAYVLLLICATCLGWAFSFGLGTQVITHWLNELDVSDTVIGVCQSFYYLGVALGSCAVPWMNRRFGPIRCAALGLVLSGVTLAVFPWTDAIWLWYSLRLLSGWAGAMTLVPLETLVSRDSPIDQKTRNFGCYGVALTVGGAIGIGIGLHLCGPGETRPFYLGAIVPIAVSVLFFAGMARYPQRRASDERKYPLGWRRNFLSYGTAWCQGFLEGGMLVFLSLFLVTRGFSTDEAGVFMGVTMVGVILFQIPVAWLADRLGRTPILLGCYAVVAVTLVAIPWLSNSIVLAVGLFCFGACSGAMYPLGLALLGDRMPEAGLARAYAWYLAVECVGSQLGAAAMGKARDRWGDASMFTVGLAAMLLVLTAWLVVQGTMKTEAAAPEPSLKEEAERCPVV